MDPKFSNRQANEVYSYISKSSFFIQAHETGQDLPQGTVLSCLLFNVLIDDLRDAIERSPEVSCLLFADDVIIWATSSNIKAFGTAINTTMTQLDRWGRANKMEVNTEKTIT